MPDAIVVPRSKRGRKGPALREEIWRIIVAARYPSSKDTMQKQRDETVAKGLFVKPTDAQIFRVARWLRDPTRGAPPTDRAPGVNAVSDDAWAERRGRVRAEITDEEWQEHRGRQALEDQEEPWRAGSKRRKMTLEDGKVSGKADA